MKVKVRTRARQQAREIARYIRKDSPQAAQKFVQRVRKTTDMLRLFPEMGGLLEAPDPAYSDIRCIQVFGFPNHLLLYRVQDDFVDVICLVHGARDLEPFLREEV